MAETILVGELWVVPTSDVCKCGRRMVDHASNGLDPYVVCSGCMQDEVRCACKEKTTEQHAAVGRAMEVVAPLLQASMERASDVTDTLIKANIQSAFRDGYALGIEEGRERAMAELRGFMGVRQKELPEVGQSAALRALVRKARYPYDMFGESDIREDWVMYDEDVKKRARELDPECWVSYSGKPRSFKSCMEVRRTASLEKAQGEADKNDAMPAELAKFLTDLPGGAATEVWKWLDKQPYAVEQMIDLLAETHPRRLPK